MACLIHSLKHTGSPLSEHRYSLFHTLLPLFFPSLLCRFLDFPLKHSYALTHTVVSLPPQGHWGRAERRWKWIQPCCKWQRKSASVITPRNTQAAFFLTLPCAFCPPSLPSSQFPHSFPDSISFLFPSVSLNSPLLLLSISNMLSLKGFLSDAWWAN